MDVDDPWWTVSLAGGFSPTPLKNMSHLGWLPTEWKNKTCSKPPTRFKLYIYLATLQRCLPELLCWEKPSQLTLTARATQSLQCSRETPFREVKYPTLAEMMIEYDRHEQWKQNPNLSFQTESWLVFLGIPPFLDYELIPNDYWVGTIIPQLINQHGVWILLTCWLMVEFQQLLPKSQCNSAFSCRLLGLYRLQCKYQVGTGSSRKNIPSGSDYHSELESHRF